LITAVHFFHHVCLTLDFFIFTTNPLVLCPSYFLDYGYLTLREIHCLYIPPKTTICDCFPFSKRQIKVFIRVFLAQVVSFIIVLNFSPPNQDFYFIFSIYLPTSVYYHLPATLLFKLVVLLGTDQWTELLSSLKKLHIHTWITWMPPHSMETTQSIIYISISGCIISLHCSAGRCSAASLVLVLLGSY